jgi:hypothetical protein
MAKLLLILLLGGALADIASGNQQPPLLIDSPHSAPATPAP